MEHLKYLSWINYFFGVVSLFVSGMMLLSLGVSVALMLNSGGDITAILPSIIGAGVFMLVTFVLSILYFLAGGGVAKGRRRGLQTVLSVLALPNCPVGLLYGGYSLWICWSNEPTKNAFDEGGVF